MERGEPAGVVEEARMRTKGRRRPGQTGAPGAIIDCVGIPSSLLKVDDDTASAPTSKNRRFHLSALPRALSIKDSEVTEETKSHTRAPTGGPTSRSASSAASATE